MAGERQAAERIRAKLAPSDTASDGDTITCRRAYNALVWARSSARAHLAETDDGLATVKPMLDRLGAAGLRICYARGRRTKPHSPDDVRGLDTRATLKCSPPKLNIICDKSKTTPAISELFAGYVRGHGKAEVCPCA
jgi:hypothetical protein